MSCRILAAFRATVMTFLLRFTRQWASAIVGQDTSRESIFAYSNIGYQIMGYLLEEITGKSSAENVRERILQPLGMTHSEPLFTHDTYTRLATGYAPLYDDRPNHSSSPLIEATWLEYAAGD